MKTKPFLKLRICCVNGKNLNPQDGSPNGSNTDSTYATCFEMIPDIGSSNHVLVGKESQVA